MNYVNIIISASSRRGSRSEKGWRSSLCFLELHHALLVGGLPLQPLLALPLLLLRVLLRPPLHLMFQAPSRSLRATVCCSFSFMPWRLEGHNVLPCCCCTTLACQ